jgi:hypothetical protein
MEKAFRAADDASRAGAVSATTGSRKMPWARVFGSNNASRSPVSGSRIALPALA